MWEISGSLAYAADDRLICSHVERPCFHRVFTMGGDLGADWGDVPPKDLRWGTAHASVPPIF